MNKRITRRLLFGIIPFLVLLFFTSVVCVGEIDDEILKHLNNYSIPSSVYNSDRVSPTAQYYKGLNEYISPESGALILTQTDLILPGRNGLDLNISRIYMSNAALVYKMEVDCIYVNEYGAEDPSYDWCDIREVCRDCGLYHYYHEEYYNYTDSDTYLDSRHGLGVGWSFAFPSIEDRDSEKYIHMGNGTIYRVNDNQWDFPAAGDYSGLDEYYALDWTFKSDNSERVTYSNGSVHTSSYVLTRKDRLKYYFESGGNLLLIKDRFGNRIQFETQSNKITRIRDSTGRIIQFTYTPTQVKITWEDKQVVYNLSQIGRTGKYSLNSVADAEGRVTQYTYTPYSSTSIDFDSWGGESPGVNYSLNLVGVTYPTGASSHYTYLKSEKNIGDGYMEYYKIQTRYDMDNIGNELRRATFSYNNEPDGYPNYKEDTLPDNYTYTSTITYQDGLAEKYTFNKDHLCIELETYDPSNPSAYKVINKKEYNTFEILNKEQVICYDSQGEAHSFQTIYNYDVYKDLRSITDSIDRLSYTEYESGFHQPVLSLQLKDDDVYQGVEFARHSATGRIDELRKMEKEDTHTLVTKNEPEGSVLMRSSGKNTCWFTPLKTYRVTFSVSWYAASGAQGCFYSVHYRRIDETEWTLHADRKYSGDLFDYNTGVDNFTIDVSSVPDLYEVRVYFYNNGWLNGSDITVHSRSLQTEEFINTTTPIITNYLYDPTYPGNMILEKTTLTDGTYHETDYQYDASYHAYLSKKWWQVHDVDGLNEVVEERYEYDSAGRPIVAIDPEGRRTEFEYDKVGRIIWETYPSTYDEILGKEVYLRRRFTYSNTPEKTIVEEMPYSSDGIGGYILEGVDYPRKMVHTYDGFGRIIKLEADIGKVPEVSTAILEERTYNLRGNLATSGIYQGIGGPVSITSYEYDKAGRLKKLIHPDNTVEDLSFTEVVYDGALPSYKIYDAEGNPKEYIYDLAGRLTGIKEYPQGSEGIGYSTGYLYDKMDNLIEETKTDGSLTRNTRYEYDFLGRPIKEIKGSDTEDMAWTAYTYDNLGNKVSEERWNTLQNQLTTFKYDELNRLIKTIDPLGHIWQNYYDKAGNLILTLDPEGNGIQYLYDAMNRKIEERGVRLEYDLTDGWEITESLILSKYSYDSYGNTVLEEYNLSANNGEGYSRTYEYNQLNLTIQEEGFIGHDEVGQPMTTVITREYDLTGQVTRESIDNNYSYIDLNSNQVAVSTPFQRDLVYNGRGWLVEERHFVWGDPHYQGRGYITINYDYDHLGNRVKITDANGDVTKYEYDGLKRPIKEYWSISDIQNPGGYLDVLKNEYQYDGVGNKVLDIDANGNITRYTYDPLNRLKEVIVGGYVTGYEYDKVGNLLSVIFPKTSEISYEYDNAGNQVKFIDQLGNITGYTYYANNLLKTITDRKGQVTTYNYDLRGLLTSVENLDGIISYSYDDAGNRIEMTDSTGTTLYTYDGAGNLKATEKGDYMVQYFYDHLGNRIKAIDPDNITIYGYDPLSRLQRVQTYLPGGETTYRYDLAGRRIELQYPNGTYTTYEYTPFGWLESLTNRDANTILSQYTYSYDAKGNQLTKRNLDGSKVEYEYDDLDQLIEEAYYLPGETTLWKVISYTYDEVGNRATKLVREQGKTDEITRYHYDAANRLIGEDIYL